MCKAFTNTLSLSAVEAFFAAMADLASPPPAPSGLFTPGHAVPVIPSGATRLLTSRRWGWDKQDGGLLINARSETVAAKPVFSKHADARRCLIPADGFYEFQRSRRASGPWLFSAKSAPLFGLAGLMNDAGAVVILTTAPNACVRQAHNRMPVLLRPDAFADWLDPRAPFLSLSREILMPWPADDMSARPPASDKPRQLDLL